MLLLQSSARQIEQNQAEGIKEYLNEIQIVTDRAKLNLCGEERYSSHTMGWLMEYFMEYFVV